MKHLMLGVALLLNAVNFAQDVEFSHSAGATGIFQLYKIEYETPDESYSEFGTSLLPAVTYNPRLDFVLDRDLSLSLTSYPSLSFQFSANSRAGMSDDSYFLFEMPTGLQLNFGNHSTQRSRKDFGGFFMAGYNFGMYPGIGTIHSIAANGGVKFEFRDQPVGLRFQFCYPLGIKNPYLKSLTLLGVGLLYNFER